LKLLGKVYVYTENKLTGAVAFQEYDGKELTASVCGSKKTGKIIDGQFCFTMERPENLEIISAEYINKIFEVEYTGITLSSNNVRGFVIPSFFINDSEKYFCLTKENYRGTSWTKESVMYAYVDKDITVSGKTVSLTFKAGWNAVYNNMITQAISLANPKHLRWTLK
jgi:hypothetical protein